jgi:transposase
MPSMKTASFQKFNDRLNSSFRHAGFLFNFFHAEAMGKKKKNWRFKCARFNKKAMAKAAKKLVGERPRETLIGFGDWSQRDGFVKGKKKAPIKKLRRAIRDRGATVVLIDEFRTSKCCSACKTSFVMNMKYRNGEGRLVKSHEAVRCKNNECRYSWHRDANAARNIREVLLALVRGEPRPAYLARATEYDPKGKMVVPEDVAA